MVFAQPLSLARALICCLRLSEYARCNSSALPGGGAGWSVSVSSEGGIKRARESLLWLLSKELEVALVEAVLVLVLAAAEKDVAVIVAPAMSSGGRRARTKRE